MIQGSGASALIIATLAIRATDRFDMGIPHGQERGNSWLARNLDILLRFAPF
jgi:hypothetical protein